MNKIVPGAYACLRVAAACCLTLLLLAAMQTGLYAQPNITRVEWYIDSDPGIGNATPVSFTPSANLSDLSININPSTLSAGVHQFNVRARDANGNWSLAQRYLFVKPFAGEGQDLPPANITRVEWYIDNDPGLGNATPVAFSPGTNLSDLAININPGSLGSGVHQFNVRARNANGQWSLTQRFLFVKPFAGDGQGLPPANITRVEWYIDNDSGIGNGNVVNISPGTNLSDLAINIDPATLGSGVHQFNVRARDANGNWSLTQRYLFVKPFAGEDPDAPPANLAVLEYYIDTDLGFGKGIPVPLPAGAANIQDLAIPVDLQGLSAGSHRLYLRARDVSGKWSLTNLYEFTIPPAFDQTITITGSVPAALCRNSEISVAYTATGTYSAANNFFRLQLSDATGSFANPIVIGSVKATASGTITGVIPGNTPGGTAYRLRVIATDPQLVSLPITQNISIGQSATINCPQNITVDAPAGQCGAVVNFTVTSPDGEVTYSHQPGSTFPVGVTTVRATVTTACGQTSCSFTVTVLDKEKPVVKCRNITVSLGNDGTATIAAQNVNDGSTDNCGIASFSIDKTSFTSANLGANNVVLTVTDASGNTSTCSAVVTVQSLTVYFRDNDGDGWGDSGITQQGTTPPDGYVTRGGDCNDNDVATYPGAPESCDGKDNDCDGAIDEGVQTTWYRDADGDGYGVNNDTRAGCTQPQGYVLMNGDCNDQDAAIRPGATELCDGKDNNCNGQTDEGCNIITWYRDADGDGFGDPGNARAGTTQPAGFVANSRDCNDADVSINPDATEICDGKDNNCNGLVDDGVQTVFYRDADGDGFGNAKLTTIACTAPQGYVANSQDCNDESATAYPGAPEVCDGLDNDCDGQVDEGVQTTWYRDADGDTYGDNNLPLSACAQPAGYVNRGGDCADNNAAVRPGATELCANGIDDNCNGLVDEGCDIITKTWYRDADGDSFGDPANSTNAVAQPQGFVASNTDCNDGDAAVYPGAPELCDGKDNNCNGAADEGVTTTYYEDSDGDGFGKTGVTIQACAKPAGYAVVGGDCADNDAAVYPGAAELCDGKDNNCNGQVDEGLLITWYRDADGDGLGDPGNTVLACVAPEGFVSRSGDCNDLDPGVGTSGNAVFPAGWLFSEGSGMGSFNDPAKPGCGDGRGLITPPAKNQPRYYVATSAPVAYGRPMAPLLLSFKLHSINASLDPACAPLQAALNCQTYVKAYIVPASYTSAALPPASLVLGQTGWMPVQANRQIAVEVPVTTAMQPNVHYRLYIEARTENCNPELGQRFIVANADVFQLGRREDFESNMLPGWVVGANLYRGRYSAPEQNCVRNRALVTYPVQQNLQGHMLSTTTVGSATFIRAAGISFDLFAFKGNLSFQCADAQGSLKCSTWVKVYLVRSDYNGTDVPDAYNIGGESEWVPVTTGRNHIPFSLKAVLGNNALYRMMIFARTEGCTREDAQQYAVDNLAIMEAPQATAAELCGNGIDDNCNGLVDEDCGFLTRTKVSEQALKTLALMPDAILEVKALPNPSAHQFTIVVNTTSKEPVHLRITDMQSRLIEVHRAVGAGRPINLGSNYASGTYLLEVQQGQSRKVVKLLKLKE